MEKINIVELLKNCPIGMELDCTIYEDVILNNIDNSPEREYPIQIVTRNGYLLDLTKYGTYTDIEEAKCIIFPKGKTTWEGFIPSYQFNDGDVVATTNGGWIGITKGGKNNDYIPTYCIINDAGKFEVYFDRKEEWTFSRFATKVEKQKLFDVIKEHGYKWNAETKTLEKLVEPKFKVGDKVQNKNTNMIGIINLIINDEREYQVALKNGGITYMFFEYQDDWELVKDDIKPKFKVGNKIKAISNTGKSCQYLIIGITDTHYTLEEVEDKFKYTEPIVNDKNWELVHGKFDISTLKPFDKVLVRQNMHGIWGIDFFSFYNYNEGYYHTIGNCAFVQCIPYEGNEHLLGTTNDCDEFYKNW